jgi:putative ABC transport system ATP-binding protein
VATLLQARDLTVTLLGDAGDVRVLDSVDLDVGPGEIVDVSGPSGSGKSTLLRALARLLPDASGSLSLGGASAESIAPSEWRSAVALVPQKPTLIAGTVRQSLLLPWTLDVHRRAEAPGEDRLVEGLLRLGVEVVLDRDASRLSVGQVARIAFLRTLLTAPRVLLLDEPDAALDDVSADAVAALTGEFAAEGGAVVRVRHHRPDGLPARRMRLEHGSLFAEGVSA